jgi:hypothetical protein
MIKFVVRTLDALEQHGTSDPHPQGPVDGKRKEL